MKFRNPFVSAVEPAPEGEPNVATLSQPENAEEPSLHEDPPRRLGWKDRLHWWNIIAFLINTIITYGVGSLGWLGHGINNAELSEKYQSLVTPRSTAFSIWAVIFLTEGLFTILQWFVPYRSKAHHHVQYYFIAACLFQAAWTVAFSYEVFWLSLLFMLGIWISLLGVVSHKQTLSVADVWWLGFPFQLHFAWITAAAALNVNVLAIDLGASAAIQLAIAILTLSVLFLSLIWSLLGISTPSYTVAAVMAWATWWISSELQSPKPLIVQTFSTDIIQGVEYASLLISITALVMTAGVVVVAAIQGLVTYDAEITSLAGRTIIMSANDVGEDADAPNTSQLTAASETACGAA